MSVPPSSKGGIQPEAAKESWSQIKSVQTLIERCLQQYMTQVSEGEKKEEDSLMLKRKAK